MEKVTPIILHISDLHFKFINQIAENYIFSPDSKKGLLRDKNLVKTRLEQYAQTISDKLKIKYQNTEESNKYYMIVTGDIADAGIVSEFKNAKFFLECMEESLDISKERILIVLGDHDINREDIVKAMGDHGITEPKTANHRFQKEKFKNFINFLKEYKNVEWDGETPEVDDIEIKLNKGFKIKVLGLNSNYPCGLDLKDSNGSNKVGYINFNDDNFNIPDSESKTLVFLAWHHHLDNDYHDSRTSAETPLGHYNKEKVDDLNQKIREINDKFDQKTVLLVGEEHNPSTKEQVNYYQFKAGTLGQRDPYASFSAYKIIHNTDIVIECTRFRLVDSGTYTQSNNQGVWITDSDDDSKTFILYEDISKKDFSKDLTDISQLGSEGTGNSDKAEPEVDIDNKQNQETSESDSQNNFQVYYNPEKAEEILREIHSKGLFKTGHFHWSDEQRVHGWINTSKFLETFDNLILSKSSLLDILDNAKVPVKENNEFLPLKDRYDFIIPMGIEGNILATRLIAREGKKYIHIPYSNNAVTKKNTHIDDSEKFGEHLESDKKKALFIFDVVNSGHTIIKTLENNKYKNAFDKLEEVYVLALFFTGEKLFPEKNANHAKIELSKEILNSLKNRLTSLSKVQLYSVVDLAIDQCPYLGPLDTVKNQCQIMKFKLEKWHKLYN